MILVEVNDSLIALLTYYDYIQLWPMGQHESSLNYL